MGVGMKGGKWRRRRQEEEEWRTNREKNINMKGEKVLGSSINGG